MEVTLRAAESLIRSQLSDLEEVQKCGVIGKRVEQCLCIEGERWGDRWEGHRVWT